MLTQCLKKTPALADPPFNTQDQQIPLLKTTLSKRPCPVPQLSLCPQSLSVLKLRSAEKLETAAHIWTATLTSVNQVPPAKIFIFNPGVYFGLLRAPNWTPHPQQVLNCFLNRRWKFWLRGKKKKAHCALGVVVVGKSPFTRLENMRIKSLNEWNFSRVGNFRRKAKCPCKIWKNKAFQRREEIFRYLGHGFKKLWQLFCPPPSGSSSEQRSEKTQLEREEENIKCQDCPQLLAPSAKKVSFSLPFSPPQNMRADTQLVFAI